MQQQCLRQATYIFSSDALLLLHSGPYWTVRGNYNLGWGSLVPPSALQSRNQALAVDFTHSLVAPLGCSEWRSVSWQSDVYNKDYHSGDLRPCCLEKKLFALKHASSADSIHAWLLYMNGCKRSALVPPASPVSTVWTLINIISRWGSSPPPVCIKKIEL